MFNYNRFKKGFSLVELIVVMGIMALFVLIAVPKFIGHTKEARLTTFKANIKELEGAADRYYLKESEWPRATDEGDYYTKEELEEYSNEILNRTGKTITLESEGKYYPISYSKLKNYIKKPKDDIHYIIQNPVGEVFYLDSLTENGKVVLGSDRDGHTKDKNINNKPVAIINMSPEQSLTTSTTITWDYSKSYDAHGDSISNVEWEGIQDIYTTEGAYKVKLRVQNSKGIWSDWSEINFIIDGIIIKPNNPSTFNPTSGTFYRDEYNYVTWTITDNWGSPLRGQNYRLEYRFNNAGDFIFLADTGTINEFYHLIPETTSNTNIEYRVRAENSQEISNWTSVTYSLSTRSKVSFSGMGNTASIYMIPTDGFYIIDAEGAMGGKGGDVLVNTWGGGVSSSGNYGSNGILTQGVFEFKQGDVLYIYTGTKGKDGGNGVNQGGGVTKNAYGGGGGGGAASHIRLNSNIPETIIISAKGGDGGSGAYKGNQASNGYSGNGGVSAIWGDGTIGVSNSPGTGGGENINLGTNQISKTSTATNGTVTIQKWYE